MKRGRKVEKGKRPVGFLVLVLVLLIGVVSVQISSLYAKNKEYEKQALLLEQELQSQLEYQIELLEYKEYINSPEYIEQLAREKFGLVKPNETLFIRENSKE